MLYIQVLLSKNNTRMTTWIEKRKNIKEGCYISLKETGDEFWKVEKMYKTQDKSLLHTDWKVGGLL